MLTSLLALISTAVNAQPAPLAGLDDYVRRAMREWDVPGLAIGVVHDTSVVFLRGYGVRERGRPDPVDGQTIFGIGSLTKAFTAAAIGSMVDGSRLGWGDRVANRLPGFMLADPLVTRDLTVRDLLAHRTGFGRVDMTWYGSGASAGEVVRRLRYAKATSGLRERFNYQNVGYIAAGEVLGAAAHMPWDEVVRQRLLEPLGMRATSTRIGALYRTVNLARPHAPSGDTVRAIAWRDVDNGGPAVSMNSSAADLVRWVRFHLDSGRVGGRALLSRSTFLELRRPQVLVPLGAVVRRRNPHLTLRAYAFGWFVEDYRGREVLWHRGTTDGMSAVIALLPQERMGLVLLANSHGSALPIALMYRVFDAYLGAAPTDWSDSLLADHRRAVARGRGLDSAADIRRIRDTRPTLPLTRYVGVYADSLYGEVHVRLAGDRLVIVASAAWHADLEHWHYDTFRVRWHDLMHEGSPRATFVLDEDGSPSRLVLDIEGPTSFSRVGGADAGHSPPFVQEGGKRGLR